MSRSAFVLLLVLLIPSLGATTCRFTSSNGTRSSEEDAQRSGSGVVVDTRVSSGGGGLTAGVAAGAEVRDALSASVLAPAAHVPGAGLEHADDPVALDLDLDLDPELDLLDGSDAVGLGGAGAGGRPMSTAVPEPGALLVFASGVGVVAWRLRRVRPGRGTAGR